jgi:NAD(P)-dependent dehydrogenase (short-subunit alcohol dehydrogenase family)
MAKWTTADIPDQSDRVAVITGANTGLGYETALALAEHGAHVVLAVRNLDKGKDAAARITANGPRGEVALQELDLTSLDSVRAAARQLRSDHERIDLLINNAGVMYTPKSTTKDGFELQFGTNHLGHFALTGLLMNSLLAAPGSRVVTVSSNGHRAGRMNFADLQSARHYQKMAAYGRSKLANLMFTYELQRRLSAAGADTIALAAHPGTARTELTRHMSGLSQGALDPRFGALNSWWVQDAKMGTLPILRAATDPAAIGGTYYGPGGFMQLTGYPVVVTSSGRSQNKEVQRRLWVESEQLTGVTYPV